MLYEFINALFFIGLLKSVFAYLCATFRFPDTTKSTLCSTSVSDAIDADTKTPSASAHDVAYVNCAAATPAAPPTATNTPRLSTKKAILWALEWYIETWREEVTTSENGNQLNKLSEFNENAQRMTMTILKHWIQRKALIGELVSHRLYLKKTDTHPRDDNRPTQNPPTPPCASDSSTDLLVLSEGEDENLYQSIIKFGDEGGVGAF